MLFFSKEIIQVHKLLYTIKEVIKWNKKHNGKQHGKVTRTKRNVTIFND